MDIILNDAALTATLQDWGAADWASQSSTVPDSYTLIFQPFVDEAALTSAITNRAIAYVTNTTYEAQPFGTGYVSIPKLSTVQTMLPVAEAS